jgi:hypothetical protein
MHNASLWFTHTLIFTKIHAQFNQVKKNNDTKYVNLNTYQYICVKLNKSHENNVGTNMYQHSIMQGLRLQGTCMSIKSERKPMKPKNMENALD